MIVAGVQACNQLDLEGEIHSIQMIIVRSLGNCWNRYTNRWLQLIHFFNIHLIGQRSASGNETPREESN